MEWDSSSPLGDNPETPLAKVNLKAVNFEEDYL
jgi:hypothetical protein